MAGGKRGRPRKPDALNRLKGTARKDRQIENTPKASGAPRRPTGLSRQAIAVWQSLAPKLTELGLLAEVDASAFAIYCQAYGDWIELTRKLNKLGVGRWYFETESGYRQVIPELAVRDKAYQVIQRIGPRFGLDPSSRSGIDLGLDARPANTSEEFLFGEPKVVA